MLAAWTGPVSFRTDSSPEPSSSARAPFLLCTDAPTFGGEQGYVWLALAADAEHEQACRDAGADEVLRWPAEAPTLLRTLNLLRRLAEARLCGEEAADLLAALAHDARLAVFSLRGYAGLLADGSLGALTTEQRQAADSMIGATRRLERLLADGLDLADSRSGGLRIVRQPIDLRLPLARAVETLEGLAKSAGVRVQVSTPTAPVMLLGDADRLERAVTNLLANAIQHSPGGRSATVALTCDGADAVVIVADHGRGVDPADRARLFERDYRTGGGSRVLGLSLVRELAEGHGGTVTVGGEPGQGARFELRLPLAPA